ncbi:MAG: hypothetical protein KC912_15580 [Proteobacteria bacterium]|nr:hypothetical protein [Pseudomonadota bacterium]
MSHSPMRMLDGLKVELQEVTDLIQAAHRRLADQRSSRPTGESELRLLWERRDALVSRIGTLVAEQVMAGHSLTQGEATQEAAPTPAASAPAPVEPVVRVARRRVVRQAPAAPPTEDRTRLAEFVAELGNPEPPRNLEAFLETYERLRYTATHCNRWLDVPTKAQRHLVGAVVAWMRDMQETNDDFGRPLREPQIVGLISRLSHWSRENRPGWVNGLARGATPDGGSWRQDTLYHIEALQGMLTPARASSVDPLERLRYAMDSNDPGFLDQLGAALAAGMSQSDPALAELFLADPTVLEGTPYQTLLRRVLDRLQVDSPVAGGDTMDFVPIDWEWNGYAEGQHVLLLGGEPSATAAAALKDAFDFSKVTWDPADARREGSIVRRIETGAIDLVLFLGAHAAAALEQPVDDACAKADVPMVIVPDGYTVRGVRRAIEDELEPFADDETYTETPAHV